jgi:voltage-gated potassium channel Kch
VIRLILWALVLTAVTVLLHGALTAAAARSIGLHAFRPAARLKAFGVELVIARLVSKLLLVHLADTMVWAAFFVLIGALPDIERAMYFSLTSYTTVGYGDVLLPEPWRLLGPLEAAVGVLMLGWSTGILVAVIGQLFRSEMTGEGAPANRTP